MPPFPVCSERLSLLMVRLALSRSHVKALLSALFRQQRPRLLTRTQTKIHGEESKKARMMNEEKSHLEASQY